MSVELQQLAVGCTFAGATFIFNPFPCKFFFLFFFSRAISNHVSENTSAAGPGVPQLIWMNDCGKSYLKSQW